MDTIVTVEGPCPLIWCQEIGSHGHPVCESCGCLGASNIMCTRCCQEMEQNFSPLAELAAMWKENWYRFCERVKNG